MQRNEEDGGRLRQNGLFCWAQENPGFYTFLTGLEDGEDVDDRWRVLDSLFLTSCLQTRKTCPGSNFRSVQKREAAKLNDHGSTLSRREKEEARIF